MSASGVTPRHLEYKLLSNGIHIFVLNKPTREAVDEFMDLLDGVTQQTAYTDTVLTLLDVRESGLPSLKYLINAIQKMVKRNRYYGTSRMSRTAILYDDIGMVTLIHTGMQMMEQVDPGNPTHSFMHLEDAVCWLLDS